MRLVAVLVVAMLALAGCADEPRLGGPEETAQMRQQADNILARWEAAYATAKKPAFAPTGILAPIFVGDGAFGGTSDLLATHPAVLDITVPEPGPAELRWPDASTRPVVAMSVADAVPRAAAATNTVTCTGCEPVHVTRARFTTMPLDTIAGPVTVPAWEFTFLEYLTRALVPAVRAEDALVLPVWPLDKKHPLAGLPFNQATSTEDRRTLTITLSGVFGGADKPCGRQGRPVPVSPE